MGKQTALEYAEARLAEAKAEYAELEDDFGEDLVDFEAYGASGGNSDDAYNTGTEHGETFRDLALLPEIIALLKEDDEVVG